MRAIVLLLPRLVSAGLLSSVACKVEHPDVQSVRRDTNALVSDTGHIVIWADHEPIDTVPSGDTAAQLIVSETRIGPIPMDSSMGYIARVGPTHMVIHGYLETTPIIGWDFAIRGLTVYATQQDSRMDLSLPAYSWVVNGPGTVVLPGNIRLHVPTVWSDLRRRVPGPVEIETGELGTRATFHALPGLEFRLEFESGGGSRDPDSLPPATQVADVEIWRR